MDLVGILLLDRYSSLLLGFPLCPDLKYTSLKVWEGSQLFSASLCLLLFPHNVSRSGTLHFLVTLYPSATFCVPALLTHKQLHLLNICNNAISLLLNTSSPYYFNAFHWTVRQIANTLSRFTFLFYRPLCLFKMIAPVFLIWLILCEHKQLLFIFIS